MTEQYNCDKCENPDSIEDMVECEDCLKWFHYSCVGVTANISKQNWKCNKCLSLKKTSKAGSAILSGAGSRVSQKTYLSKQSEIELELEKLEAERILEEKHRKQKLELEQQNLKLQQQQKQQQIQLQNQKDIEEKEKEYLKKRFELKKKLQSSSCGGSIKNDIFEKDVIESVSNWLTSKPQKVDNIKQKSSDFTNIWNLSKQVDDITVSKSTGAIKKLNFKENIYGDKNETWSYKAPQSTYVRQGEKVLTDFNDNTTNFYNNDAINKFSSILSSQQLASRKAFSKDLPYFNGLPEGWPLFISSFNATTQMCGYTNEENLIRLQKALKGRALETVRSKLMLPINVPSIIKTLGNIFGRPELILQNLIAKIKSEPLPKFEKFETIRDYALSVENLCATMEASNMIYHINNPILLQELIDRLPTQMKYDWASHVRAVPGYNISTLSIWLNHVSENLSMVSFRNPSTTMMENKQTNRRINNYKDTNFIYTHREEVKNKNDFKIKYNNQTNEKKCCICGKTCTTIKNCQTFQNLNLEEKWNAVHKNKLCRTCLVSHNGSECFSKNKCLKNGCTYRHNPLLHNDKKDQRQQNETSKPVKTIEQNEVSGGYSCTTHQQNNQSILFRIVPVVLYGENSKVETFAFLDEGSSLTLMEQQLAEELNLNGIVEPLCLRWTSNNSRVEEKSERVNLKISSTNKNAEKYSIINARTVSSLNLPKQTLSSEEFGKYKYMKGLSIKTYMQAEPRILIGLDNSKLGASLKLREGGQYEPIAVKTRLGWIVYGALQQNIVAKDDVKFNGFHICECEKSKDDMVQQIVKDYILLDNLGVSNTNKSLLSKDDERSMQILESSTNKIGNRFETGLIWKYDQFILPNSLPMAKRRLECLEKKMQREPELAANIKKKISEYIEKNYIHKITKKELLLNHPRVWYLPIFTVTNPNKPGKIRMVWDAAAKVNGVSLNEMLLKGPDQLASLPAILQRFRERKIGICGDIKEMFHQIRIKEDDRQSQRFLYRDDPNKEPDIYVMDVMTFGATCSPSCAQFIKNKNALSYIDEYPNAVNTIIENHYVDDLLESVDTEEDAIKLANDVKFVHQQGGFEICNWISNSEKVINALGEKVKIANKDLNIDPELEIEKILGMWWCTSTDTFTYSLKYNQLNNDILNGKRCPTKREVLRTLMKIYDPLGLIANFLIYLKILLQDIWRSSVDWDDEITKDQYIRWLNWISVLPKVEKIQIQRCYIANTSI